MDKKIIFFDIDGTILDEKTHTIPQSTIKAISQAQKNGHICIVNTGRPSCTIDQCIKDVGFDGYICGCGTNIIYQNQDIFYTQLSENIRRSIISLGFDCQVDCVLEGKNGTFFPTYIRHPFVKEIKENYKNEGFHIGEFNQNDIVLFDKLTVWYDNDSDIERFKNELQDNFEIIQRDVDFVEIVPLGYSKATGIQMLIDYLHMSIDQTISIGDSTNDLSMLTYTKESVAMGNGNPVLFDKVTYRTSNVDEDGIYHALKHYHLN